MSKTSHFLMLFTIVPLSGCSSLLYHPSEKDFSQPTSFTHVPESLSVQKQISAWHFRADQPKALILFFHGNAENMTSHASSLYFAVKAGYDLVAFDYRGYGKSVFAQDGQSITPQSTVEDGIQMLLWAQAYSARTGVPWMVFAQSLGGAVALRSLIETRQAVHPRLIVLESTFRSYQHLGQRILAGSFLTWPFQWLSFLFLSDSWAPGDRLNELPPAPTLVIHGNADPVVPYEMGRDLFEHLPNATRKKEFWHIEAGQHTQAMFAFEGQFRRKFIDHLDMLFASKARPLPHTFATKGWPDFTVTYSLPFEKGQIFEVIQGYNGAFSHFDSNRFALDFAMPEGTPVCAMRSGEVISVNQDSTQGGPGEEFLFQSNFILIRHEDASIAEYYHLKTGGAKVQIGEQVQEGQLIGFSGQTGQTSEPHLHVAVHFFQEDGSRLSIPTVFNTAQGPAMRLQQGESYTTPRSPEYSQPSAVHSP